MSKPCPRCDGQMHRQSSMCRVCYDKKRARPESYISKDCPVCGKSFTVHKIHIERGQGKYCSKSCARSGSPARKRTRLMLACHLCGKQFDKHLSEIKKSIGGLHFCSRDCWYEYNQLDNHYGYAGGQNERVNPDYLKWRKNVLKRDHGYCRLCHSIDRLEAHHIHRFTTHTDLRWDVDNGLTLCHDCHVGFRNHEEEYTEILSFIASVTVQVFHV